MKKSKGLNATAFIDRLILGGFLDRENPFSATHQPRLRSRFSALNDRVSRAWTRTVTTIPGAVVAALAAGPIYRGLGLPDSVLLPLLRLAVSFAATRELFAKAYRSTHALYYREQPSFTNLVERITTNLGRL